MNIGNLLLRQVLREFIGLENSDTTTKEVQISCTTIICFYVLVERLKFLPF